MFSSHFLSFLGIICDSMSSLNQEVKKKKKPDFCVIYVHFLFFLNLFKLLVLRIGYSIMSVIIWMKFVRVTAFTGSF